MIRNRENIVVLLLFLSGLIIRIYLWVHTNYTADDSFITFRYAENISSGLGFVYNPGEKVLGTTTPLYTLILSLHAKTGFNIIDLGKAINILADCLAGVLVFFLLRSLRFGFAFLASLFYLLFPRVLVWSISGMETGLYIFLISLVFYFYNRKDFRLVPVFLALACLTRIDGLILIAALSLDYLLLYKKIPWKIIGLSFLYILPWILFAAFYFGSPIPNSIWAKKALYQGVLLTPKGTILWEFLMLKNPVGWLILILSSFGIYRILKNIKELRFVIIWSIFYLCFYLFSNTRIHTWYYVPFYLGYLTLAALGSVFIYDHLSRAYPRLWKGRKIAMRAAWSSLLIFAVILISFVYYRQMKHTIKLVSSQQIVLTQVHKKIGMWIKENTAEKDTICAEDIGYMGYFSRRYILDQDGLISPQVVPFNRTNDRLGLLQTYLPRYLVFGFYGPFYKSLIGSEWFKNNYKLLKRFSILEKATCETRKYFSESDLRRVPEFAVFGRVEIINWKNPKDDLKDSGTENKLMD
jgi:hypothetical protein